MNTKSVKKGPVKKTRTVSIYVVVKKILSKIHDTPQRNIDDESILEAMRHYKVPVAILDIMDTW